MCKMPRAARDRAFSYVIDVNAQKYLFAHAMSVHEHSEFSVRSILPDNANTSNRVPHRVDHEHVTQPLTRANYTPTHNTKALRTEQGVENIVGSVSYIPCSKSEVASMTCGCLES